MKTKSLFLVFSLCALIHIYPVETEQSKDGKQFSAGATKEFKTKIVIDMDESMGGGGHGGNRGGRRVDGDWGYGGGWERGENKGGCEGGGGEEGNDEGWGEVGGTEAGLGGENEGGINGKPRERA
ncbi:unnamed protein product [Vicia faba]|uniref:Glycine-rich protein n=1 Tax=Vicia faba TaxID=3906 RepID=A0AAV0YPW6_VICFA|nr:unnamed protein product [Vicia faba]